MLSSKTNALLTHTLASFWRKQSCINWIQYAYSKLPLGKLLLILLQRIDLDDMDEMEMCVWVWQNQLSM